MTKKKTFLHLPLATLLAAALCACSTSMTRGMSDTGIEASADTLKGVEFVFFENSHEETRYNADEIFNKWASGQKLFITAKRLQAVSPKEDGCTITYDYRVGGGKEKRISIFIPSYRREKFVKQQFGRRPPENPFKRQRP